MSIVSKVALKAQIQSDLPDNGAGAITPALLRGVCDNIVDSYQDLFQPLTQTQINALTPSVNMIVYNTDLGVNQVYTSLGWMSLLTGGSNGALVSVKVSLSSADILNSFTSPIQLIPSQGLNTIIVLHKAIVKYNYATTDYDTNTDATIRYSTSSISIIDVLLDFTTSEIKDQTSNSLDIKQGDSIEFATTIGNPANGDSTIDLYLTYQVINI